MPISRDNIVSLDSILFSITVLGLGPTTENDPVLKNMLAPDRENAGRPTLKRGASDTSDLSSSPPLAGGLLHEAVSKSDSLHRSSSTSDISNEKLATKVFQGLWSLCDFHVAAHPSVDVPSHLLSRIKFTNRTLSLLENYYDLAVLI